MTEPTQTDTLERIYLEYDSDPAFTYLRKDAKQIVRGDGPSDPLIILIGELPGAQEDETGKPFAGRSGELLDELLSGIGVARKDVFITNIIKYRPKDTRTPTWGEIIASQQYLQRELSILDCDIICTLGRHTLSVFFPESQLSNSHGKSVYKNGKFYIPLYHPARAVYKPAIKPTLMRDFQEIGELIDRAQL